MQGWALEDLRPESGRGSEKGLPRLLVHFWIKGDAAILLSLEIKYGAKI